LLVGGWQALGGKDAGEAGEVVGDGEVGPMGKIEEWLDGRQAVVAKLKDEQATGFQMTSCFRDESAVEFVAFFTSEESGRGLVVADFPGQRFGVTLGDVRRVADDKVERKWRVVSGPSQRSLWVNEWREPLQQIRFEKLDALRNAQAGGVAAGNIEGGGGDVRGIDGSVGKLLGQGYGDAAGTGADIHEGDAVAGKTRRTAGAEFVESEAIEGDLDEMFGFRTRD